ncbi:MAG: condensation domain-containing protein, partial [Umezawaea sp.]
VVGYFANTLPIRLTAVAGSTFRHAVRAAHRQALAAVDHQYTPFDRIVAEVVGRDRDRSHRPLVRVAFTHHGTTGFQPRLAGLRTRAVEVDAGTSRFDLLVEVREAPDGTTFSAEYDSALFTERTATAMLDEYLRFLRTAVHSPGTVLPRRSAVPRPEQRPAPADPITSPGKGSDTERVLAGIWAEVLRVPSVAPTDDFFALGGDSMTALTAIGTARARGLDVTVAQLFRAPTISGLAAVSRPASATPVSATSGLSPADRAALPAGVEDAYPVSALQMGIAFHCEMTDDPTLYHDLVSVRLRGPVRSDALRRALREVASRHDVLRTSFDLGAYSAPLQLVHRDVDVPLTFGDATSADPHVALRRWWDAEWHHGFDLGTAPLWRCHVLAHPDGTHHLSVTAHHTILDGWSFASLMTELLLRYDGGHDLPLTPPDVRYHDFVLAEQADLRSAEIRSHWVDTTRPAPLLPTAVPASGPPRMDPDAVATIPSGLSEEIGRVALALGVHKKSVYLAAHVRAVHRVLGVDEVATGVVVNGRPESLGAERTLGLFLNTLPLRVRPAAMGDRELITAVAAFDRDSAPFRRFPLAEVQRGHGAPLFHVRFNFADFHVLDQLAGLATVRPLDWWSCDRNEIPLSVEVNRDPATANFEICVRVDEAVLPVDTARLVADALLDSLTRIVDEVVSSGTTS